MNSTLTGVILAGGRGQRMLGQDKGLLPLAGKPLVAWVAQKLAPQVDNLLIVANRHLDQYAALGYPVVSDRGLAQGEFLGPLAGFEAALTYITEHTDSGRIVTCPVDAPLLVPNYVARLQQAATGALGAVARCENFLQPAHVLLDRQTLPSLQKHLAQGHYKVSAWLKALPAVEVDFDEFPQIFHDADTPEQLAHLHALITGDLL